MFRSDDFEGHIACSKSKINFINNILINYPIHNVSEIGFNAGHSAAIFLNSTNINNCTSFDLCTHTYSSMAKQYMKQKYKHRLTIICGNSQVTIPKYNSHRFDLVFIDGGHYNNVPYLDIQNSISYLCKKAH